MVGHEVTELIQGFVVAMNLETTEEELFHHLPASDHFRDDEGSVLDAYGRVLNM
jgi:dihydrolipoamide dehydrogenase